MGSEIDSDNGWMRRACLIPAVRKTSGRTQEIEYLNSNASVTKMPCRVREKRGREGRVLTTQVRTFLLPCCFAGTGCVDEGTRW